MPVASWTPEELNRIGNAEELDIVVQRADGTLRKPVTVWVVRVGDDLFVRSYKGHAGAWHRAALSHGAGRVVAGGVEKQVDFVAVAASTLNDQVDAAYRTKYRRYSQIASSMLTPAVRATTLRLVAR